MPDSPHAPDPENRPLAAKPEQDRFQAIVAEADEGIIVLEPRAVIGYANQAAEFLLGHDSEELVGEMFGLPLAPSDDPVALNVVSRDGSVRLVELRIERLASAPRGTLVVRLKDVTDYDRRVTDAHDQVRRRDEFLAMLSHELRNPLAAIHNAAQLLSHDDLGKHVRRDAGDILERQFSHLARILDDLLDISRISRGKLAIAAEPVELREVVADAIEAATPLITKRGHTLQVDLPPEEVWVRGDPTRLEQIVVNLLNNAAKFTPPGGNIAVALAGGENECELRVQDDGPGIADELRPHIFDSFVQGSQTLARSEGGLGIGLALVRTFVGLHGGAVDVESGENGIGTTFIISLPALQARRPPEDAPSAGATSPRPLRVLLVEDNEDARRPLRILLQADGYEVLEAGTGPDGLALLLSEQPDVALIDIGLPGMTGYEVAKRLRMESSGRRPRLFAVTGYGRPEDEDAAEAAGFDGHIVKPVCLEKLRECLEECKQAIAELSDEQHEDGYS
jgi:signal transduction histidine kinase/CheY-like chemotaxis protein